MQDEGPEAVSEPDPAPDPETDETPRRPRRRRVLGWAISAAVLALTFFFIWPASLGGWTTLVVVTGNSMLPTLEHGDLAVARERSQYEIGDIVVFDAVDGRNVGFVIHRIISGNGQDGFTTAGDNQGSIDPFSPTDEDIRGAVVTSIPYGAVVLQFVRSPFFWALLAGVLVSMLLWPRSSEEDSESAEEAPEGSEESAGADDGAVPLHELLESPKDREP